MSEFLEYASQDGEPRRCQLPPRGWYCKAEDGHDGPCPTLPRWWNWTRFARAVRKGSR